jgi:hypothetical protein
MRFIKGKAPNRLEYLSIQIQCEFVRCGDYYRIISWARLTWLHQPFNNMQCDPALFEGDVALRRECLVRGKDSGETRSDLVHVNGRRKEA